jgi:DNA-binding winged helix-turn-helix (wHTH) protein
MGNSDKLPSGKGKYLIGLIFLLFISAACLAFNTTNSDDFAIARREVLLRRIGHELLLQSGDSTSRVLPVKKIAENEYQISFENEFTFQPATLVATTQSLLAKDPFVNDYVVNVLNCGNPGTVYAFAISKNKKNDLVACIGRKQPMACYLINIKFKPTDVALVKNGYFVGGLSIFALVGFIFFKPVKQRKNIPDSTDSDTITLGSLQFDAKNKKLTSNEKEIDLTGTETRVLLVFALSPNEIIERSRLQKEIWEDEGVIVGRSLDMFISKLRKKLELDPNIKIAVVRGKGYKLIINP